MNGVRFKNRRINIWNSATIGIEVADGVKVVDFNDAEPNVELRSVKKQFPSVETLIIGKSTSTLEISNFMFPNVKEVISENNQDVKNPWLKSRASDSPSGFSSLATRLHLPFRILSCFICPMHCLPAVSYSDSLSVSLR